MKISALVVVENNTPITTSRIVAEQFGKNHAHVMRDIRDLITQVEDESKIGSMFQETTYADKHNREKPMYTMTRDGFALLAMGFTGKKALEFKLKFINAFNRMEDKLKSLALPNKDARWADTRNAGIKTRNLFTKAVKALYEYFQVRGRNYPDGYLYGHLTNLIQNALGIEKGGRDKASVKKLNQLDQSEDIAGNIILRAIVKKEIDYIAEIDAQILLQLKQLNNLLSGQLFLNELMPPQVES